VISFVHLQGRAPNIHWIGDWVCPRASLDVVAKRKNPLPYLEANPDCPVCSLVTILTAILAVDSRQC